MNERELEIKKQADERYRQSEKGRAANKKYRQSEKGKAATTKYRISEKGKATRKAWRQTEHGQLCRQEESFKQKKSFWAQKLSVMTQEEITRKTKYQQDKIKQIKRYYEI